MQMQNYVAKDVHVSFHISGPTTWQLDFTTDDDKVMTSVRLTNETFMKLFQHAYAFSKVLDDYSEYLNSIFQEPASDSSDELSQSN